MHSHLVTRYRLNALEKILHEKTPIQTETAPLIVPPTVVQSKAEDHTTMTLMTIPLTINDSYNAVKQSVVLLLYTFLSI